MFNKRRAFSMYSIVIAAILALSSYTMTAQTIGLHVEENHNVLFGNGLSGAGTKLMWLPNKQTLLAGSVNGLQWDPDSIYENNIIFGIDNQSSTEFVTINGRNNTVSGLYSAVFGLENKVIGGKWSLLNGRDNLVESDASYAIINGKENRASYEAEYAILNGRNNKIGIEADYTTVNGLNNIANTSYETVLGRYADTTVVSNYTGAWDGDHQLFAIGNGSSALDRNNALTVLKNGQTTIRSKSTTFSKNGLSSVVNNDTPIGNSAMFAQNNDHSGVGIGLSTYGGNWGIYASGGNHAGYFAGNVHITGTLTNPPSDARLKNVISTKGNRGLLNKLMKVDIEEYLYKDEFIEKMNLSKGVQRGVIAQQLNTVFPDLVKKIVHADPLKGDEKIEYLGVNYIGLIPIMVESMKEQQNIIEDLKAENQKLEERLLRLEKMILKSE